MRVFQNSGKGWGGKVGGGNQKFYWDKFFCWEKGTRGGVILTMRTFSDSFL